MIPFTRHSKSGNSESQCSGRVVEHEENRGNDYQVSQGAVTSGGGGTVGLTLERAPEEKLLESCVHSPVFYLGLGVGYTGVRVKVFFELYIYFLLFSVCIS